MARGEPIWQTSSTGPTSMPSSSEAVATSARRSPARRRVSTMRRRAAERLPWWAATSSEASTSSPSRRPSLVAQPLGQLVGHPLGHLAGVDEDQRGAVLARCARRCGRGCRRTGRRSPPLRARWSGSSIATSRSRAWPQSTITVGGRSSCTPESRRATTSSGRCVAERPMRCRWPPLSVDQRVQPLEAERQVAAPLVAGQRVHLVDDDGAHAAQHGPRGRRGEEQVERLGRGDEQVGRLFLRMAARSAGRRVAGADGDAQPGVGVAQPGGLLPDLGQRDVQVLVHVDGQGPQRGDVEDLGRAPAAVVPASAAR